MPGWRVDLEVQPDSTLHVWPDLEQHLEHDLTGGACICGPALKEQANGVVLVTHHSLDGRELHEPDRR